MTADPDLPLVISLIHDRLRLNQPTHYEATNYRDTMPFMGNFSFLTIWLTSKTLAEVLAQLSNH